MDFQLSQEEIKELRRIQQKDRFHRRRFVKATVLIMLHRQLSIEDIEVSLGIDDNTIRRYVKGYRERGLKRYMQDGYISYCGKLSKEQEQQLVAHLDEFLYPDAGAICVYVNDTFGVEYTVSGLTDLLHRLGYVYKKSRAVAAKADEVAQAAFLEE
jgi:transposase